MNLTARNWLVVASFAVSVALGLTLARRGGGPVAAGPSARPLIGLSLDTLKEERWQRADYIDPTQNVLRAEAKGDRIVYFLNGHEVLEFHDGAHSSGSPMLWVQDPSQTTCFSDITISSF